MLAPAPAVTVAGGPTFTLIALNVDVVSTRSTGVLHVAPPATVSGDQLWACPRGRRLHGPSDSRFLAKSGLTDAVAAHCLPWLPGCPTPGASGSRVT